MDYNYFQKLNRYFLSAPSEDFSSERGEKDPSAAQEAENVRRLIGLGSLIAFWQIGNYNISWFDAVSSFA